MVVTWVTLSQTNSSLVEYGIRSLENAAKGSETMFQDGGSEHRKLYIHRVTVTGLKPGQKYMYHCGSQYGWSSLFTFTAMRTDPAWIPRVAVYGDMGNENPQSLARLQQETQKRMYDAIFHIGDFAYDMDSDNARVGDEFMRQIESVAAYIPYMVTVGNHESPYNFSNYRNRFSMPRAGGDGESLFYSLKLGKAHIIGFSTEVYFYFNYGFHMALNQYRWLERELQEANKPENRAERPWLITMAHRPMYCSTNDYDDCTFSISRIRTALEGLFYKSGVDLMLWAHEHIYERLWPIYNMKVCNGSNAYPYTNPGAPVHIITGSAGCKEKHDPFKPPPYWSAFRSSDYGYTRMTITNATHLYFEQVSDDQGGAVIDKFHVIKHKHGAGSFTCS
ncbi:acid phosphatase type 7-like [Lingula anatina]|uniref:Purple acid phosphatase n=1 Tax=Lingula anatina TaxID=7574 RepID=A0A1S3HBI2_LINAN|nr:acid phosphatase type 7-like [Lingula anatina]|eukprot:XP_013383368.1 acid phosphatase type 7-like [Lingula anatina]